jgi:hypothetical protein
MLMIAVATRRTPAQIVKMLPVRASPAYGGFVGVGVQQSVLLKSWLGMKLSDTQDDRGTVDHSDRSISGGCA